MFRLTPGNCRDFRPNHCHGSVILRSYFVCDEGIFGSRRRRQSKRNTLLHNMLRRDRKRETHIGNLNDSESCDLQAFAGAASAVHRCVGAARCVRARSRASKRAFPSGAWERELVTAYRRGQVRPRSETAPVHPQHQCVETAADPQERHIVARLDVSAFDSHRGRER